MAPQKKLQKKTEQGREGNDSEAGRQAPFVGMFSRRWAYLMCYAMLEYYGIRLVDRRSLLSLEDRVLMIESADYSSSDDWQ